MTHALSNLRELSAGDEGIRSSFEEFCCQIFRRSPDVPVNSIFRRVRGDGGDGGVEAFWTLSNGDVWGLQAKYFRLLGPGQKRQIAKSIRSASANYPHLTRYIICLPTNLTAKIGASAGKPKPGQHERLSQWISEWQAELASAKRLVNFVVWDESELLGRLASADITGGLTRYWFDKEILTRSWFSMHLEDATAQAGPRYNPRLTVATPLDDSIAAFGRSEAWIAKIDGLANRYAENLDRLAKTIATTGQPSDSVPTELVDEATSFVATSYEIERNLSSAAERPDNLVLRSFRDAMRLSISQASALEPKLRGALLAQYGDDADSARFRQWRAEYMADFPMGPLDELRDIITTLAEVEVLAFQPEGRLPAAPAMLLRGAAGIGKTHGIIDSANRRSAAGLLSLVLFGEDVSGPGPWHPFTIKLGLGSAAGHDAMLDALNAAGEATGFPLVIFIDALNETEPDRRKWQSWLPPMIEQVKRRPFLKLCVSCRDIYVREVIPHALAIPAVEHHGFLGREYEAQFAFFQYYGVGVPAEPLLQEEFANPLFLRLLCEALRNDKKQIVPAGREGIRALINLLLQAKNARAAIVCDFDPRESRVGGAMLRLAKAMATAGRRALQLSEAKRLVDESPSAHSQSLFTTLESESLITTVERPPLTLGSEPSYTVRFLFERIGDHLITESLLTGVTDLPSAFAIDGSLHFLVIDNEAARSHFGILEALSIHLPEVWGEEIVDVIKNIDHSLLWGAFIAGLQWRAPQFVTTRTKRLILEALNSVETSVVATEAILGLAARPDHPLNIRFLDRLLVRLPLLRRDPIWANILENSYSGWSDIVHPKSPVYRLIETARRGRLDNLDEEVAVNWAITLAWFCASPDRRIRDRATIAMVSIFVARAKAIAPLLRKFCLIDDDYISERVVVAAYGALLLNESATEIRSAASAVYELYFAEGRPPLNASLRDHARLIIEMSLENGVPLGGLDAALFRPPYTSDWPIIVPSESDIEQFAEDTNRFPQMNLVERVGMATGTDFARYVVEPRVVSCFDLKSAGIDRLGIFRWFLREAVNFGYPGPEDQCALFDRHILSEFGGGRAKPGWAERLGKKYYWIFLRQMVGQVADHLDRKTWSATLPPSNDLQGLNLRDIDPSDLRSFLAVPPGDRAWLTPAPYLFRGPDVPDSDDTWLKQCDLTDISKALVFTDGDRAHWQAIDIDESWSGKRVDRRVNTYRHVSRSVSAVTCAAPDIDHVKNAFAKRGLSQFHRGPHDYRGYLGEYPRRWPYACRLDEPITFESEEDGIAFQYLVIRQLRGTEWGYDHSQHVKRSPLLMPSADLIRAGSLRWDHCGGWQDLDGNVQVQDPFWSTGETAALLCRTEYIDRFLYQTNRALIILGIQTKFIAGMHGAPGPITEETLFIRHHGELRLIKRRITKD